MQIKIKTLTGKVVELNIEPTDTIYRVKEMLEEKEGIDPKQQRLIFGGKQIGDELSANSIGVRADDTLHLVLALRGGY